MRLTADLNFYNDVPKVYNLFTVAISKGIENNSSWSDIARIQLIIHCAIQITFYRYKQKI